MNSALASPAPLRIGTADWTAKDYAMSSLKWIPDTTGCEHSFEDPVKKKGAVEYGWCAACQSRVAIQLNQLGKPTGESEDCRVC